MLINIFILLGIGFLFTFIVGYFLEKIRVPWIFGALLYGTTLSFFHYGQTIIQLPEFELLGELGMYFLLFSIGFELDLSQLKKRTKDIVKSTIIILGFEAIVGSLFIHFVFDYSWFISILVAMSFATVGEAILVPILKEFNIVNKPLGQMIIGVGTADDILEIITLIFVVVIVTSHDPGRIATVLVALLVLFLLTLILSKFGHKLKRFVFIDVDIVFFVAIGILFAFLGIGQIADAAPLAAFLAGISIKTFLPKERYELAKTEVQAATYGFFAPIFFIWVGASIDFSYLLTAPGLVVLVVVLSSLAKIIGSIVANNKRIGLRKSVLLGIGLSVRFSTSIIIVKILLENQLISNDLYSLIIASSIAFKFIIPVLFSYLIVRWEDGEGV